MAQALVVVNEIVARSKSEDHEQALSMQEPHHPHFTVLKRDKGNELQMLPKKEHGLALPKPIFCRNSTESSYVP
jgi:hypothetical protein